MIFFKKPYLLRRYAKPENIRGYVSNVYQDLIFLMDIQTSEEIVITTPDGSRSVQKLEVFCDQDILVENTEQEQKADRLWFQGKWFECRSRFLSDNTLLRHWVATFIECLDQEPAPEESMPQ